MKKHWSHTESTESTETSTPLTPCETQAVCLKECTTEWGDGAFGIPPVVPISDLLYPFPVHHAVLIQQYPPCPQRRRSRSASGSPRPPACRSCWRRSSASGRAACCTSP